MSTTTVNVADVTTCKNYDEVLQHIHVTQTAAGIVKETYLNALREREADYPTGILLDGYSVAIHTATVSMLLSQLYILFVCQRLLKLMKLMVMASCGSIW
ncbi:PTS IIA-like nitrogen-regulatory protein PtsN (plasmid) [Klebsiella pneumoniae]|nr:PTS IIA-like nitrogen-regulatory protein PtsN [Klebsiella pneumoniae]